MNHFNGKHSFALLLLLVLFITACEEEQTLYTYQQPAASQQQPTVQPPETTLPPGHPPIGTSEQPATEGTAPPANRAQLSADVPVRELPIKGLVLSIPEHWQEQQPANTMRAAQLQIPAAGGATEGADFVIFYFGPGQGGDAMANVTRWIGQIELDEGFTPEVYQQNVNDLKVTEVYAEGTLQPSTMGTGPSSPQPGSSLYGIIIEGGPQGSLFIKATGAKETIQAESPAIVSMIDAVKAVSQ